MAGAEVVVLPWTYAVVATSLVLFAAALAVAPDDPWIARAFYVWLSVFNLLVISVAWSVLADLMPSGQATRLFAAIAAGISVGGLVGPLLGVALVGTVGIAGLLVVAAAPPRPLGGNLLAGIGLVLRSRYLLGIAAFVVMPSR